MDNELLISSLSVPMQLGFAVGHILNDVCASMWFTYFLIFFHVVLGFSSSEAGVLMLIGQVVDAFATPFIGYSSDHTNNVISNKYGKRKLWHLFGTICTLLSFPFIFTHCVGCESTHKWAQMYYYASFIMIFQIGWAAVQVNHLSLIPELSDSESNMTHLTALRYGFSVCSNIFVYLVTWAVLHIAGSCDTKPIGPGDEYKFSIVTYISLGVGVSAVTIFHMSTKEPNTNMEESIYSPVRRTHVDVLKEGGLYKVAAIYMCSRLVVNVAQAFIPLYTHKTLQLPARAIALAPLALYGGALAGAAAARIPLTVRNSGVRFLPGSIICFGSAAAIYFCKGDLYNTYFLYVVTFSLGMGSAWLLVVALALTAELIGARTETSAFIYGLMSFTDKISTGLAIIMIQKFSETSSSDYYRTVLTAVTTGACLVGLICASIPSRRNYEDESTSDLPNETTGLLQNNSS